MSKVCTLRWAGEKRLTLKHRGRVDLKPPGRQESKKRRKDSASHLSQRMRKTISCERDKFMMLWTECLSQYLVGAKSLLSIVQTRQIDELSVSADGVRGSVAHCSTIDR
ncbi:hypothetical protein J6590_045317 [Homalodisca vitripennis]|nr:hypothetical protein J6590_045317 [Homalodisca vitripennis]